MYLKHLSLTNFRNFARLDLDVPRRAVLLVGSNAQGKTSVLEAVYFLATFASFQTHTDRQLVNFIATKEKLAVARIVADFVRGNRSHRLEVRIIVEPVAGNIERRAAASSILALRPPASILPRIFKMLTCLKVYKPLRPL